MLAVVIVTLTFSVTTNLVLSCPSSPDITQIPNFRLCNDSDLSILFNVSNSCDSVRSLHLRVYNHNSSAAGGSDIFISHQYLNYSDQLCGVNVTLNERVKIDDKKFSHKSLLQIRLREVNSNNIVETCSNNFYLFIDYTGFLGPPVDINSNSYNCSTINVTWSDPDVNCGNSVKYNLSIYDDITDQFLWSVSVDGTSYQFVDENLFRHRYTYVISADNDLNEGISNNDTFSYQRVPKSAMEHTTLYVLNYTQDMATVEYNIPVIIECTGEAPENATVTIQCNGTGVVVNDNELIEYEQPNNITGLILVLQYQQCILNVTFSNGNGSSEPFILAFNTTPPLPPYISSSLPTVSKTPTLGPVTDPPGMPMGTIIGIVVGCFIAVVILALILVLVAVVGTNHKKKNRSSDVELKEVKQRDENGQVKEELVQDGGPVHVKTLDDAAGRKEVQIQDDDDVRQKGSEQDDGGLGQKEVIQNGREGQEEVQEDVIQNPVAELKDVGQEQEDGAVEQGIAIVAEVHVLTDDSNTTASLAQDPVPEPKEVAQNDMTEKETADEVLVDNTDTTTSKSNDKEIESADSASDSKKPSKDKYHKDTYNPKRQLLDPSSSVAETNVDHLEYNAYYDEPEVPDEAGHKETETTYNDQQLPRQFLTISIPRPTAGDHPSAIFFGSLSGAPVLEPQQTLSHNSDIPKKPKP